MNNTLKLFGAAIATTAVFASITTAATFQSLGFLPGQGDTDLSNVVQDVSADGSIIVGWSNSAQQSFLWTSENGMVALSNDWSEDGSLNQRVTARALSADGQVIVGNGWSDFLSQPVRGTADGWTAIEVPFPDANAPHDGAYDVSSDGNVIVGQNYLGDFAVEAFIWTEQDGMVGLGVLSGGSQSDAMGVSGDGTTVAGNSYAASGSEAYIWTADSDMTGLGMLDASDTYSKAWAISRDGSTVVGESGTENSNALPFVWTEEDGMSALGSEPGVALAVSADGSVVVGGGPWGDTGSTAPAFIWDQANGWRELQSVLVNDYGLADELAGWTLTAATAISDDGLTIAGIGINPDGHQESWVATIPEPATALLLAAGCLGLIKRR